MPTIILEHHYTNYESTNYTNSRELRMNNISLLIIIPILSQNINTNCDLRLVTLNTRITIIFFNYQGCSYFSTTYYHEDNYTNSPCGRNKFHHLSGLEIFSWSKFVICHLRFGAYL